MTDTLIERIALALLNSDSVCRGVQGLRTSRRRSVQLVAVVLPIKRL